MANPTANPSGALAVGTNLLFNGKFTVNSIALVPDGTNACSVTVYDNIVASGKIVAIITIPASQTLPVFQNYSNALKCEIGVTVVVAGTGSIAYVSTGGA